MQSLRKYRISAAVDAVLYLAAWWLLYGGLPLLLRTGRYDAVHVLCEGASAAVLLVLFVRSRRTGFPVPGGRPGLPVLLLVPVFFLMYASIQMFQLAGGTRYAGSVSVSVWYVLRTCLTAPVMEELGCRWILFYKLRRGFGFWPAALASAVMFSLIHMDIDAAFALAVVPSALLYCLIYEVTGRFRYCVAGHMAFNVLALPGDPAWESFLWGVPLRVSVPLLVSVTVGIVLLCAFRDRIFARR